MKYVLLFAETEEFAKEIEAMSEPELQDIYERVGRWLAENEPRIIHRGHLQPAHTATTVRLTGGDMVVTDGPFVEGKEVVTGYALVDVADLDEALAMVSTWPSCPLVEIRPLDG